MIYDRGITVLYEPSNAEVDIVFVHGFTGHPMSTWTLDAAKVKKRTNNRKERPGGAVFWPQDLLPITVPTARILTYGYDTKIRHFLQGQISKNTLQDHAWDLLCELESQRRSSQNASRPLVFVAHSLGGVVVRDALRQASHRHATHPHHHALFISTISIMFFGTPHRGADPRSGLHRILSASAIGVGVKVNKHIMDTLLPTFGRPTDVDNFKILAWEAKWTIYSFQEETGVGLLFGKKVVEDNSSYLGPPVAETIQHISDNHMDMCRFHGLDDPGYLKVAAAFQRIFATNDTRGLRVRSTPSPSKQPSDPSTQQHIELNIKEGLPDDTYMTPGNKPLQDQKLFSAGEEKIFGPVGTTPRTPPTTHVKSATFPSASDTEGMVDIRPEGEPKIDLDTKKKMVDLLKFSELGARMHDIQPAQMQTCQWFLTNSDYTKWKNGNEGLCDSGFLWIKGKPGAGKSTLMKYLHSIHSRQANCTVISFFFNARGAELEKSTLGCYRTLLFLLLDGQQEVWEAMDHLGKAGSSYTVSNGWNIGPLTETLKNAVELVAKKQPVECWIDALDECQDSEVEQMVSFFEDLDEFTLSNRLPFRVCFASRHYPTIVPRKAIQLVLEKEEQHEVDISTYIASRLRLGDSIHKSEIQSKLQAMSSGIFLWVVLVIPILNREYARGNISALRKRLDEIPPGLDALFHSILTRDQEDMQELLRCLQWILCSIRPLKPLELYTAIQPSANSYSSGHFEAVDPRSPARVTAREDEMSTEDLHHYVDSISKGLAEVTSSSTAPVQFIHESVGDFLLGKSGRSDLLSRIKGFNFGNPGEIHEILKQVCLEHILAAYSAIFSDDSSGSLGSSAYHTLELHIRNYSFLHYAVTNVLRHADQAYRGGISQTAFLQEFPIHRWSRLYNALGNVENDFTFKIFHTAPSILYLLAQFDAHHLLRDHPELHQQFKIRCGGWGYPWMVAAKGWNIESLRHLVNAAVANSSSHVTSQEVSSMIHAMNRLFSRQETPPRESDATVAAHLAAFGHGPLLESFLVQVGSRHCECQKTPKDFKTGPQICRTKVQNTANTRLASDGEEWGGRTAIFYARTAEPLEVLLAYGADPNVQDQMGWTVVHSAVHATFNGIERLKAICSVQRVKLKLPCSTCSVEPTMENSSHNSDTLDRLFQLLAPRFDINIRDKEGRTALHEAARRGRDSARVQILWDAFPDIDIHLQDNESRSPLSYAVEYGKIEAVKLLLSHYSEADLQEADLQHLNRPDKDGRTIVSYAADTEEAVDILRLLLGKFPQIALDTPDNEGRTPLRWALEKIFYQPDRSPEFIKALLATGQVNPFHAAHDGQSPFGKAKLLCMYLGLCWNELPAEAKRDLLLEMIKTAENKEVMGKFQFGDEDFRRIEEEMGEARKLVEEMDLLLLQRDREQSELDEL